jgi:hypothetical protein
MARSKEGLITAKDKQRGLAEGRGIELGEILHKSDKEKGLLTKKDRDEGLM